MTTEPPDRATAPYLSAREAAAELGVSLPTLYAYVSRGLVRSEPVPGERARRYRAEDVRALRERRAPPSDGGLAPTRAVPSLSFSAFNAPVLSSAITLIADGELYYRGVRATELAKHATLETAAGLLWQTAEYDAFEPRNLPARSATLRAVIEATGTTHPIDRCIAALAVAGEADDAAFNKTDRGLARTAARITRLLTGLVGRRDFDARPVHLQLAEAWGLDAAGADLVRMALVLLADHELNASTFTLRCAVSTDANLYDGMIAALAALKGPLHGGATTRAERQLEKLVDGDPIRRIREQAEAGERFAGFGHPLYREGDPRAKALLDALEARTGNTLLTRDVPAAVQKVVGVRPNVDYALAALAHAVGLPRLAGIGLFAIGRSIGWAAHAREQLREHALIRPRAIYSGPAPNRMSKSAHTEGEETT